MSNGSDSSPSDSLDDVPDGLNEIFDLSILKEGPNIAALDEWRQGDLVAGARIFWAADAGNDPLTGSDLEEHEDGGWHVVRQIVGDESGVGADAEKLPAWGIITSQTCDISAVGPGSRHPLIQVSPLVRLDRLTEGKADAVRQNIAADMVLIPNAPANGEWAADLRISLPLSKSLLLAQSPLRGFPSEHEAHAFSEQVAAKIRRPALHDGISGFLVNSIQAFVENNRVSHAIWMDRIEQFRVRIKEGTPLKPSRVEIIIVTLDEPFTADERTPLRQWKHGLRRTFPQECGGAKLVPLRFIPLDKLSAVNYRDSYPMFVTQLGQGNFW